MVFLLISFSTIYAKFTPSYGQISLVPDNSLIAQTTDCITSMMTSALIGINSDCTDNLDKTNSTAPDKAPDSTTAVSSSDKAPDSTTSVSSSDKAPDSTTSVSSSDKAPASTTSVSSSDKAPDSTTSVSSSDKAPDSTTSVSSSDK